MSKHVIKIDQPIKGVVGAERIQVLETALEKRIRENKERNEQAELNKKTLQAKYEAMQLSKQVLEKQKTIESLLMNIFEKMDSFFQEQQQRLDAIDTNIATIAIGIAEKVLFTTRNNKPEIIKNIVSNALSSLPKEDLMTVQLCESDKALLEDDWATLENMHGLGTTINLKSSSNIEPGGCIVTTPSGSVDAQIESQFAVLQQGILETIDAQIDGQSVGQ